LALDPLDRHEFLRLKVMDDEYRLAWANIEGWSNQRQPMNDKDRTEGAKDHSRYSSAFGHRRRLPSSSIVPFVLEPYEAEMIPSVPAAWRL
jgi:hypothetical protein